MPCTPNATTSSYLRRPRGALGPDREGQPAQPAPSAGRAALARPEPDHRSAETGHGRREIRTLKVVTVAAGIAFPGARQAIQITRRTRPIRARAGQAGQVAHRDRLRDHRPTTSPGPTRRTGRAGSGALADRERPALGARRDFRRGPFSDPHRQRSPGHGHPAEPGDQPAPVGRRYQHCRCVATSRPRCHSTTPDAKDHLTLPTPCAATEPRAAAARDEARPGRGRTWLGTAVPASGLG